MCEVKEEFPARTLAAYRWLRDWESRELCRMSLKKPSENGDSRSSMSLPNGSCGCLESYKTLTEFLCSTSWEDGSRRERGSLQVTVEAGVWKLKVKDPNASRYAFYASGRLDDALAGLDLGLAADDLDWRPEKPWPPKGK
jgi:hypothetical protein